MLAFQAEQHQGLWQVCTDAEYEISAAHTIDRIKCEQPVLLISNLRQSSPNFLVQFTPFRFSKVNREVRQNCLLILIL